MQLASLRVSLLHRPENLEKVVQGLHNTLADVKVTRSPRSPGRDSDRVRAIEVFTTLRYVHPTFTYLLSLADPVSDKIGP